MPGHDELFRGLLSTFQAEADEYAKAMSAALIRLEGPTPPDARRELVEAVFRHAHSLKGAARAVKLKQIESVCQPLEEVFAALKAEQLELSDGLSDLLHRAVDLIDVLAAAGTHLPERQPEVATLVRALSRALRAASPPVAAPAAEPIAARSRAPRSSATVRVDTAKLDAVMRVAEELVPVRLAAAQRAAELREFALAIRELRRDAETVSDDDGRKLRLRALENRLNDAARRADRDRRALTASTDGLVRRTKELQLSPCSLLLDAFARIARDLARDQRKRVHLEVTGSDIEVDRRLLDELKDPLIHLVRNCIDHGIADEGTVSIAVTQHVGGLVRFSIADDGRGISRDAVRRAAVRRGLLDEQAVAGIGDDAALELVFHSGLSTRSEVTDVSGRGLGLAIVQDKVERLGGTVSVTSTEGAGTRFEVTVPITVATYRATLVHAGGRVFALPSSGIVRLERVDAASVHTVNRRAVLAVDGRATPLVRLEAALGLAPTTAPDGGSLLVAIIGRGQLQVALVVDALIGEQEILVKPLGSQLRRVRNVSGACILGDGRVVPVLNLADLATSAAQRSTRAGSPAEPPRERGGAVLVAEDSITSRLLMKNILETAGYAVTTTADGVQAYEALKNGRFDALVSDVEMPRMDGFELTERIRSDDGLAELPVVLVTTMKSDADRARGAAVGANAYIVKSSFDESDLLDTLRRLV